MRFRELALEIILTVCKWTNFEWGITIFSCTSKHLKGNKNLSKLYISTTFGFWFSYKFFEILKKKWVDVFFKENVLKSWELKWSVPDSETCLQLFFELFREMKKVFWWVVFQSYQLVLCSNQELGTWHVSISLLNDLLNLFCAHVWGLLV